MGQDQRFAAAGRTHNLAMPAVIFARKGFLVVVQHPDFFSSMLIIFAVTSFRELDFNRRKQQLLQVIKLPAGDREFKLGGKPFFQGVPEAFPGWIRTDVR